ncbi:MAG TPA: helix-turn-helix domain-containing GNAT family N-acetyltransferase [Casimicrobiaceae bacterium]|nr:helix-turn-helix domain-containing GNAT family N-acetyltransferase [Casimicrobiaceae bacterium]
MSSPPAGIESRVAAVRHFNRFYTRKIGVLQENLLSSALSLTEVRVLYELGHERQTATRGASALATALGIDGGYLSRILGAFERRGMIRRKPSPHDRRRSSLALSARGARTLARLEARSRAEVETMLRGIDAGEQRRLVDAMRDIERLLGESQRPAPLLLRAPEPGDIGWVVHRHGALYAREYGYDARFEALVAEIAGAFVRDFDPRCERCWIAERGGQVVGSVFLVRKSARVAKLRLLLVEPSARGLGLGTQLVDECVRFARRAGYRKMVLWTQSELLAARKIYQRSGFRLVASDPHHSFGRDLVAETWELQL